MSYSPVEAFDPILQPRARASCERMDGSGTSHCPHCGERIAVSDYSQPVSHIERDATESDPRTFLIIGADRLLHRCEIGER